MDGADLERLSPSDASCVCTGTYQLVMTGADTQSGHEDRDWNPDLDVDVDLLDHDGQLVSPPPTRAETTWDGPVRCYPLDGNALQTPLDMDEWTWTRTGTWS